MSLLPLTALPVALNATLALAETTWQLAVNALEGDALARWQAWPDARQQAFARVLAASDFVSEQASRDPLMLLDLADSGELERSLAPGELREQFQAALATCVR